MKIKVISDLHLEFSPCSIDNTENCDALVLAGDIFTSQDLHDHPVVSEYNEAHLGNRQLLALRYREFLSKVSSIFEHVLYVPGNHEYYRGKFYAGTEYLDLECSRFSNVHFLEGGSIVLDDIAFVGGALWTDMNNRDQVTLMDIKTRMNDFQLIRNDKRSFSALRPIDTVQRHDNTKKAFASLLEMYKDKKCVVISHHGPSFKSVATKYLNEGIMNGAFVSNMDDFILDRPQIKLWCHGHTHTAFDYMLGDDTRIVCNPRGYETATYVENPNWNQNAIIVEM